MKPNPLTPFPSREGGKLKASLLLGERFGEGFSRYREKSDSTKVSQVLKPDLLLIYLAFIETLVIVDLHWTIFPLIDVNPS